MNSSTTSNDAGLPDGVVEFDMYAVPPPKGDWNYTIDDTGIIYRRGLVAQRLRCGWWPFAYADPKVEHRIRREIVPPVPVECGAASVRLAPDCGVYSWHNEYVTVRPSLTVPHHASATLTLWVRAQGAGGMVTQCSVHFDLLAGTHRVKHLHPALPAEVKAQATTKAVKLSAFLAAEVKNRDGDDQRPATVADRVREHHNRPGRWREPAPRNEKSYWSRHVNDGVRYLLVFPVSDGWRWAVCQYGTNKSVAAGKAEHADEAMALADAAVTPRWHGLDLDIPPDKSSADSQDPRTEEKTGDGAHD